MDNVPTKKQVKAALNRMLDLEETVYLTQEKTDLITLITYMYAYSDLGKEVFEERKATHGK